MFDTATFAQGLVLGLGLFICPGPKDVLILKQALSGRPALQLLAVGTLSDATLILFGTAGAAAVLRQSPRLQCLALALGVVLMLWHSAQSAWRALRFGTVEMGLDSAVPPMKPGQSLRALLVVSFLNPVAWLDTVLVIGGLGAALPPALRASHIAGTVLASLLWFAALVAGARRAARWMTHPKTWRVLEALVAVAMLGLALQIGLGLDCSW
ncbi:MAG: LysE family transporter [Burkholderiaceae bacterium]|nr:LysE family transporter [Burkholderiaceae bacterium]